MSLRSVLNRTSIIGVVIVLGFSSLFGALSLADARENKLMEGQALPPESDLALWYTQPASDWESEALPIGNGYMGGMIFGGIERERIQFNEKTLWTGGPGEWEDYNGGNWSEQNLEPLKRIRELIDEQNYDAADQAFRL